MAGPWEKYAAPGEAQPQGPWSNYVRPEKPAAERWSGDILPLSEGADGKVQFDSNAGLVGQIKRAVTLPGDVYAGRVDSKSPEGIDRANEMAGIFSPMNPAIRSGGYAIPGVKQGMVPAKVDAPTSAALKQASREGYDAVRDMGVQYSSNAVVKHVDGLRAALEQDGILGELAPKTFSIINKFANPPEGSVVTSAGLEAARRAAQNAARDFSNPTEQLAAKRFLEGLDGFVAAADPSSVVAGPAATAGKTISEARANYAAAKRSEKLQGVEERAELQAARANSGFNTDNAVRQRADAIVNKPREAAGFSADEIAALKELIRGGAVRNTLRTAGNLAGGGGGLGAVASGAAAGTAGGMLGGPLGAVAGAAVPAAGMVAKAASNRMALRELAALDDATRMRSPLAQQMLGQAPMTADSWLPSLATSRAGTLTALGQMQPDDAVLQEAYRRLLREGGA